MLRAAWADVDKIGEVTLPDRKTQALVLRSGTSSLRWTQSPQIRQQVTSRGFDRIIPIDDFAPKWPAGKLADAIAEHRPDLLED